jgi:peptidoglycan hydrolase-like protein with peptidoglycan-binding domain
MKRLLVLAVALAASAAPTVAPAQSERPTYEKPLSSAAVRDVQTRLRALGYYGGPVDGVWGSGTRRAVERFQRDRHIAVSGRLNQATVTAMGLDPERLQTRGYAARPAPGERVAQVGPRTTKAVQTQLRRDGYYHGAVDGVWRSGTRRAVERFQRDRRLPVTGAPSRATLAALGLEPDSHLSGSSRHSEAERLNLRERQQVERGQY